MKTMTYSIVKFSTSFVLMLVSITASLSQPYSEYQFEKQGEWKTSEKLFDLPTTNSDQMQKIFNCTETCNSISYSKDEIIGQSEKIYKLSPVVQDIEGLAFQNNSQKMFLYILEGKSGMIIKFEVDTIADTLNFIKKIKIKGASLMNPRGLTYSREPSGDVFYFVDFYYKNKELSTVPVSRLYRYSISNKDLSFIDLTSEIFGIGPKEVFGVTRELNELFISFDPSGFHDQVDKIRHGIVRISLDEGKLYNTKNNKSITYDWNKVLTNKNQIKHMPGPGKSINDDKVEACKSLASMNFDGVKYLWGTVGNDYIYLLDYMTGRGIFFFDLPHSSTLKATSNACLTFGAGHLWTADQSDNNPVVHRVNIQANLKLPYTGSKHFREINMQLTSHVKDNVKTARGNVFHTFCHPFPSNVVGRQGIISNSVKSRDVSNVPGSKIEVFHYYPANDTAIRQEYTLATYSAEANPEIRNFITEFHAIIWTREYKQFVYPHLVSRDSGPQGTRYLEDDTMLYNFKSDPTVYGDFIKRVKKYISDEYNIVPDMDNPYWASRNIVEYVTENYHYPKDEEGFYATYDFKKGNYNANPGNLKAELSADGNYTDNIIACSGTGSMVCGALRFLGIPTQWIGVSQEVTSESWTTPDNDEFLEENEEVHMGNGHRYNHVWLGDFYKWQRFDATPLKPDGIKFDKKPKEVSQWVLMQKSASGVEPRRVIQTIQSEFWPNLYMSTRTDKNEVNSFGSTRYNLLGTYSFPEDFELSQNQITSNAIQFIHDIKTEIDNNLTGIVSWKVDGNWGIDPEAKLMVVLEKELEKKNNEDKAKYEEIGILANNLLITDKSIKVDLSKYPSGSYRILVIKAGDPAIGNAEIIKL
jgi:hypothetical protein